MDTYSLIPSNDVAEYCKKIGYNEKGSWLFRKRLIYGLYPKATRYYSICCKTLFPENVLQKCCKNGSVKYNKPANP